MRIGLVCDGTAEKRAWQCLLPRIAVGGTFVTPVLYADMQSTAPVAVVVRAALPRVKQLIGKRVDRAVIVLDHESRSNCPGLWAAEIRRGLQSDGDVCGQIDVEVVIKHRMLENWLLADPDALDAMPKRFRLSAADRAAMYPNRADVADAARVMGRTVIGSYDKARDPMRIMQAMNPDTAARHSRSFRRFLRVVGHAAYARQSHRP